MIANTFGEDCEVVVHDLEDPEHSVVYVANNKVTGREIGQSFYTLVSKVMLSEGLADDHADNYYFTAANGKLKTVNVEPYGEIILNTEIPVTEDLVMNGTCVSMGNPHCVVPVDDVASFDVEGIGKLFENHPIFPERVNTEFIRVEDRKNIRMRVWERGSGETWACGTGACAVAAACILNGWTDPSVTVHLLGGSLQIEWDREKDTIFMTGPAVSVFDGVINL